MKKILGVVIILGVVVWAFYLVDKQEAVAPSTVPPVMTSANLIEKTNVEKYLRENIKTLAPNSPVLGGSWYVVSDTIDLATKSGTVIYEDGHIQSTAKFNYSYDSTMDAFSISDFIVTE